MTGENNTVVLIDNGLEITEIATVNYTHRSKCKSDFSQYFYGYRILVCWHEVFFFFKRNTR